MRKVKDTKTESSTSIESKFGQITIGEANHVNFPLGILGMPKCNNFHMVPCPIEKFSRFLLMQSGDDRDLVFMVLPIDPKSQQYIQEADLDSAFEQVDVPKNNASVVLVSSTKELSNGQKVITVNTRAPIIIDHVRKTAIQYVLQNNDYDVQKIL
jgi:flagellar assembly factor FliW